MKPTAETDTSQRNGKQQSAPSASTVPPGFVKDPQAVNANTSSSGKNPQPKSAGIVPSTQANDQERRRPPSNEPEQGTQQPQGWHPLRSAGPSGVSGGNPGRSISPEGSERSTDGPNQLTLGTANAAGNTTAGGARSAPFTGNQQPWNQSPPSNNISSPLSDRGNNTNNAKQTEDIWRAVGTPAMNSRRTSRGDALTGVPSNYFPTANGNSSLLASPPNQPKPGDPQQLAPVFQYFGSRQHGQRSFSLAPQPEEMYTDVPPGDWRAHNQARRSSVNEGDSVNGTPSAPRQRTRSRSVVVPGLGEVTPEIMQEMWRLLQMQALQQGQDLSNLWEEARRTSLPLPTFGSPVRQPLLNDFYSMGTTTPPPKRNSTVPPQQPTPPLDTKDLAEKYFNRDPSLLERRRSIATTMAQNADRLSQMSLNEEIASDFAVQYGNLVDTTPAAEKALSPEPALSTSSTIDALPSLPLTRISPPSMKSADPALDLVEGDELRQRSWSEPAHAMKKPTARPTAQVYYVVEFKGGRNDYFYIPDGSDLQVTEGDLVIVEADRGKDLGKVILVQNAATMLVPPQDPKCIYRNAQTTEVNMLLDKARDEQKALAIVQAKARQKGLDMEIVDAEYQWDRRKLTFYFVAEERIDFRDLVKDLFKIYKTRIWMCAVERSRTGVRLMH